MCRSPLPHRFGIDRHHIGGTDGPANRPPVGRPAADPRAALNAILWVVVQGKRWHHLPPGHPASQTCYNKWLTWKKDGTWQKIVDELGSELVLPPA
ncbi:transposase [Paraburkholderia terrae]|uniref:transposase n=1 Tax=Paraburkholderia terrae TaxID=311230 RepID=UPI0038620EED